MKNHAKNCLFKLIFKKVEAQVMSERELHEAEKTKIRNFSPIIKQETVLEISAGPTCLCEVSYSYPKYSLRKIKESEFSFFQPPFRPNLRKWLQLR